MSEVVVCFIHPLSSKGGQKEVGRHQWLRLASWQQSDHEHLQLERRKNQDSCRAVIRETTEARYSFLQGKWKQLNSLCHSIIRSSWKRCLGMRGWCPESLEMAKATQAALNSCFPASLNPKFSPPMWNRQLATCLNALSWISNIMLHSTLWEQSAGSAGSCTVEILRAEIGRCRISPD